MESELKISSLAFSDNGSIPSKYTADGEDVNPPLVLSGVADNVRSLTLIMDDPDAPGETYDHWVVFNISPETLEIAEDSVPSGAIVARNSAGENSYIGPAPPSGEHRYYFKLCALDDTLDLSESATKADVESAMEGKIIGRAQLIGKYERKR